MRALSLWDDPEWSVVVRMPTVCGKWIMFVHSGQIMHGPAYEKAVTSFHDA